jgi:hypothetical protein
MLYYLIIRYESIKDGLPKNILDIIGGDYDNSSFTPQRTS